MTIRIQQTTEGHCTILRLSGELVSSQREALLEEIESNNNTIALCLEEVTLVDLDVVQLLARCEAKGLELLNCPPYIREWISRENSRANSRDEDLYACEFEVRKENPRSMKMKAAQISKANGDWELVERDIPEPGPGQVRVKIDACGICHSDALVKEGLWPGLQYPRIPGHEVAGRIDAVGETVTAWKTAQRVGVGWHGGHCFVCEPCRRGDFAMCINRKVTGLDFDGGYAEYMIAPAPALAAIPDELPAEEAGPFMCAGVTVYNALRNSGARGGQLVAVHGIGGLGHLGVQYARRMGFKTVAINRGNDKEPLARQLGAHHYIDSVASDAPAELQKLGGARVILATAPNAQAISPLVDGLAPDGVLLVPAAPAEPLMISVMPLIMGRRSVAGWYSGTARDSQDTLEFSALSDVHPMIEKYPLERVAEGYLQMSSGKVRFRVVLTM
jgi:D-arabinose 1-dehydrogenase-like Zn-dependent alcohol dehydrogenase